MTMFVDTSAFYAVVDRDDANHPAAKEMWTALLRESVPLLTTNYVLVETCALLQHRIGIAAVRSFHEDVVPLLQVDWVTEERHRAAAAANTVGADLRLATARLTAFATGSPSSRRFLTPGGCFPREFRSAH